MEVRVLSPARFHRLGARARMIRNTRSPASAIRLRSRTGNRYSGSRLSTRTFANLRGTGSVKPVAAVKVDTEKKPGSQVVLSVEVDADQVLKSIDQAYSRLAPRVRIAGFRPGKAPRPMVEREIGWPALRQEALDLILPTAYNSALDEAALDPIDVPRVEVQQFERGQPMRFTATVALALRRAARSRASGAGRRFSYGRYTHHQIRRRPDRRKRDRRPARGRQGALDYGAGRRFDRAGGWRDPRHRADAPGGLSQERSGRPARRVSHHREVDQGTPPAAAG